MGIFRNISLQNFRGIKSTGIRSATRVQRHVSREQCGCAKCYYDELNQLQQGCEKPLKTYVTYSRFAANEEQNAMGEIADETFEPSAMDSSTKEF